MTFGLFMEIDCLDVGDLRTMDAQCIMGVQDQRANGSGLIQRLMVTTGLMQISRIRLPQ